MSRHPSLPSAMSSPISPPPDPDQNYVFSDTVLKVWTSYQELENSVTNGDLSLNVKYWNTHPEKCTRCFNLGDRHLCRVQRNSLGCQACTSAGLDNCSKKDDATVYILSQTHDIKEDVIRHAIRHCPRSLESKLTEFNVEMNQENEHLRIQLDQEKNRTAMKTRLVDQKSKEIRVLKKKLEDLDSTTTDLQRERQKSLEVELLTLEKKLEDVTKALDAKCKELKEDNEQLKKDLDKEKNDRKQAENERESAHNEVFELQKKLENANSELTKAESERRTLKSGSESSPETAQKMREGVAKFSNFTRDVLAGLANPLLELEGLHSMLDKESSVRGRRKLGTMERELRSINREASKLHVVAKTMLHDPDSADWNTDI